MIYHLKNIESGRVRLADALPLWIDKFWECGNFRVLDETGSAHEVVQEASTITQVSPIEFKLLFTSQERVAIKAAREADPHVNDFFELVEDPRLTHVDLSLMSTRAALRHLVTQDLLTEARMAEILVGQIQ